MADSTDEMTPVETLRTHIKGIRMAMLSTIHDGRIVSRPMSVTGKNLEAGENKTITL